MSDQAIQLMHGDCLALMPLISTESVDLLLTDPPYGIGLRANYAECKRTALALCHNFPPIIGDDKPFDPAHLLRFRRAVLFGANHYADKLPASAAWIIWDKLDGLESKRKWGFNDNSDCEMAWTNIGNATRLIPHRWMGMIKASEQQSNRVHPTQKPIALMAEIIRHYTADGETVFDPYMGSGTTAIACLITGRRFIGIERDDTYFNVACQRVKDEQRQGRLFTL